MSFRSWVQATRPRTLTAGAGPVLVGTAFVAHRGGEVDPITFALTLLCTLLLQTGANLANDHYDFVRKVDGPDRLGPVRMSASGLIPPHAVRRGFQICLSLALILGIFLIWRQNAPPLFLGVGLLCIILAWAYTGGPLPLSHYGLGELVALIIFGPVAVWGSAALQFGADPSPALSSLFWGLGPGLLAASLMALNNLRDHQSDAAAGKITLAVLTGEKAARILVVLTAASASLLPLWGAIIAQKPHIALTTLISIPFIPMWKHILTKPIDARLNRCLARTGMFLALHCAGLSLALAL